MNNETVFEKMRGTRIPDYYDGMYKEGYQPYEILEAARNSIIHEREVRIAEQEEAEPLNVRFQVEVKKR